MGERAYKNIVILTGAGISADSGLATFRGHGGLWEGMRVEDVATPEAFARNPEMVHRFYTMRRQQLDSVHPNAAHKSLAKLEQQTGIKTLIVTQNVDDLHERGGAQNIIHMHGELKKGRCLSCGQVQIWLDSMTSQSCCNLCNTAGYMRPHIVWFGEMPLELGTIYDALHSCDLFVSIGTSGNVYPAAGFIEEVLGHTDAHTLELNLEPSAGTNHFAERRYGPAADIVPAFVQEIITSVEN